ncbi:MAG: nucleoside triphosphate pyrophosphohydrolase [Gammaproteobacteria bacterium]|nr:nucleoside triphosphate pyrophosphohydrolase [Gammaproteobacteria bacterium]
MSDIQALLDLMARLRDPQSGCPWDIEQNFDSIAPYTIEEAYEVADAIERKAYDELRDELGDLLFQVVFHARLAAESGHFDFNDVVRAIVDKMTRRHPHVFGNARVDDSAEQTRAWESLKAQERAQKPGQQYLLDDVPLGLPALTRAAKLQKRAARHGFDWPELAPVLDKVREELAEVEAELEANDPTRLQEEMGDLLFACVNLARHLNLDPEHSLRQGNEKFRQRFNRVEEHFHGVEGLESASLEQMEQAWNRVKQGVTSTSPDKNR